MNESRIISELISLLGEADFIRLSEEFGGIRLYVAENTNSSQIVDKMGNQIAARLAEHYLKNYLKVPLAHQLRARHYRATGMSNAQVARKLGMTESGVEKLFRREPAEYRRSKADARQIDMFPTE